MAWISPDEVKKMVDYMESGGSVDLRDENGQLNNDLVKAIDYEVNQRQVKKVVDTANQTATQAIDQANRPSAFKSAAAGYLQGGTLGFGDEIGGAIGAVTDPDVTEEENIFPDRNSLGSKYERARNDYRRQNADMHAANPTAYRTGEFAGAMASPANKLMPGAGPGASLGRKVATGVATGIPLGAAAGSGFSNDPTASGTAVDSAIGAGTGGVFGGIGAAAGHGLGKGMAAVGSWLSKKADDLLTSVLGFKSDEIIALKYGDPELYQEVLQVARKAGDEAGFPYQSQPMRESIEGPAVQQGVEGSVGNPPLSTSQRIAQADQSGSGVPVQQPKPQHPRAWGKPSGKGREHPISLSGDDQTLGAFHGTDPYANTSSADMTAAMPAHPGASRALAPQSEMGSKLPGDGPMVEPSTGYGEPQTPQQPLSEAQQIVSKQLGTVADQNGGGILPKTGMMPSTFKGGISSAAMAKTEMVGGIGLHKIGQKMIEMATNNDLAKGMSSAANGKLVQLVDAVMSSENPELEDFLAKEMSPLYNHMSLEAKRALEDEKAGQ